MDREAWCAAGNGVIKSQTRLSDWTELKFDCLPMNHLSVTLSGVLYKRLIFTPYCCNYIISFSLQEKHCEWNIRRVNITDEVTGMQRLLSYSPILTKQRKGSIYFSCIRGTFHYIKVLVAMLVCLTHRFTSWFTQILGQSKTSMNILANPIHPNRLLSQEETASW